MTSRRTTLVASAAAAILIPSITAVAQHPGSRPDPAGGATPPMDWRQAEAGILANHVQITFADRFYKAGEPYFSPDGSHIIFQAIEPPSGDEEPAEIFEMFLADVVHDDAGKITGIDNIVQLSPEGSANTCGWFDPRDEHFVYFSSTLTPPAPGPKGGYDRETGKYVWVKPPEMRIFRCDLRKEHGSAESLELVAGDLTAYQAEGALSWDGQHIVYCSLESGNGDLYIKNLRTGKTVCVVDNPGYDGGPFFSPDGRRICYRSDRRDNSLLQIYVADLAVDKTGEVVGIEREYQLTDNTAVNFGPFWHKDGRHLIYATTEMGFRNFEVFIIDADPGDLPGSSGSIKYGTRKRRITHAPKADVLPTLSFDGSTMIWTCQRAEDGRSQLWIADLVIDLDPEPQMGGGPPAARRGHPGSENGEGRPRHPDGAERNRGR